MTAEQIFRAVRRMLDDTRETYLWEDVELVDYLNMAINDIALNTMSVRDRTTTPTITEVDLFSNLGIYSVSSTIITIQSAMTSGSTIPLLNRTESWMDHNLSDWRTTYTPTEDGVKYLVPLLEQQTTRSIQFSPKIYDGTGEVTGSSNISFAASTKTISQTGGAFTTHFEAGDTILVDGTTSNDGTYTAVTVAAAAIVVSETLVDEASTSAVLRRKDGTVTMTVIRYPISDIVLETIHTQSPEIPERWHLKLCDGIMMYAYEKDDADAYNQGKADRARARFMRTIDEIKREYIRKYHAPGTVEIHPGTI